MKKILPLSIAFIMTIQTLAQTSKSGVLEGLEKSQGQQIQKPLQQNQTATLKSSARLFGAKDDLTTVIMIIPSGSTVAVLDSDSTYYHVNFENTEGYIFKKQAVIDKIPATINRDNPTPDNNNSSNISNNAAQNQNDNQQVQSQRSRFSYLEDKYGTSLAARINSGKIWKGMTPEMVKDSWGSPQKINRVVNGNTLNDEWTYKNTVLYFRDNSLIEWGPVKK